MFKNLIIYRIAPQWEATLEQIEEALAKAPFMECGATQEKSLGWVPPRGEDHGALVESIGGQLILRFMVESKSIPGSVLARKVKEKADRIEQETGRKPGRKETKELKDEAKLDLLPMAFPALSSMWIWIDPAARLLVLDASSQGRADEVVTLLVESLSGLSVSLLNTQTSPQAAMAHWLKEQEPPEGFTVDRECELKSANEEKSRVVYGRHPLDIKEVQAHIDAGKLPTKLALTWDDRVSFILTEGLQIKKMSFLDTVSEGKSEDADGFDADVAIATGEMSKMIPGIIGALGGEAEYSVREGGQLHLAIGSDVAQAVRNMDNLARENGHKVTLSVAGGQQVASFGEGPDPMYSLAAELVCKDRNASISYVQRKLRIGYNRAARLLEAMEKQGVVSVMAADGSRTVLEGAHPTSAEGVEQ